MRLILVRHGETAPNRDGIALGRADVPLTETGIEQARRLGEALAEDPIVAVYSSPLQRAMGTAKAIADVQGLDVVVDEGLIEMDIGEMDGLTYAAIREAHPGFLEKWAGAEGPEHAMPGGERLIDVAERSWYTVVRLGQRHQDATVVAVTHNFVILTLLARVMGIELANFRRLRHGVAAISILDVRYDRARVLSMNDACHLAGV